MATVWQAADTWAGSNPPRKEPWTAAAALRTVDGLMTRHARIATTQRPAFAGAPAFPRERAAHAASNVDQLERG